jgi:type IX secretion system PorP/SprF family membrane protein
MATMKNKLPEGDALGIGVMGTYDRSGVGSLQAIQVGLSAAYHKAFGLNKQHTFSIGVQGVLVQKSIDFNKLKFEDQFDPASGLTPFTTGENFQNKDLTYPDFNLGLMYSGRVSEHATAYIGGSVYHLTTPEESFLSGKNTIHRRYYAYLGGSFDLNENMVLYASALYQGQASATEVMLGAAAGFILNPGHDEFRNNTVLYLGGWYRYGDGVCPYIGLEWTKATLGISYDINTSSFTPATGSQGAYEISLVFNGKIIRHDADPSYNFSCPKF